MRTIEKLFAEYAESHQNAVNKNIHWVCVPLIVFSIIGLLYSIKIPVIISNHHLNIAFIIAVFAMFYYVSLSVSLAVGLLAFVLASLAICHYIEVMGIIPLWLISLIIFAGAWVGQFFGHRIEGKKPSFLKDIQFLLIGPAWLLGFLYKRLSIPF